MAAFQDADAVVDQFEGGELGVDLLQGDPQGAVEGVDRAVALAVATMRSLLAHSLTVASLAWLPSGRSSAIARQDSTSKYFSALPSTSPRSSSSKEASAASYV